MLERITQIVFNVNSWENKNLYLIIPKSKILEVKILLDSLEKLFLPNMLEIANI